MRAEETSASKPSMNCRKRRDDVRTKGESLTWEKSERYLLTAQAASGRRDGVNSVQALVWNVGTCVSMGREQLKWKPHESLSTEARYRDGVACSSEESS